MRGVTGHEEHGDVTVGQGQRAQVPRGADGPSLSLLKRPRGGTVEAAGGVPAGLRSLSDGHEHRGQGTRWTGRAWEAGNPAAEGRGPAGGKGLAERAALTLRYLASSSTFCSSCASSSLWKDFSWAKRMGVGAGFGSRHRWGHAGGSKDPRTRGAQGVGAGRKSACLTPRPLQAHPGGLGLTISSNWF